MCRYPVCLKYIADFSNLSVTYNLILIKLSQSPDYTINEKAVFEEAIFVKRFAEWEAMIYKLITYCVSLNTKALSDHVGLKLPLSMTIDNVNAILHGFHFTSFNSVEELNNWASKLIVDDLNPFQQFLPPMMRFVDEAFTIRNYIVHKSLVSKNRLLKMYKSFYNINDFIEPGMFFQEMQVFDYGSQFPSRNYSMVFSMMAIFSWRLLDQESYALIFETEKARSDPQYGYLAMDDFLTRLATEFDNHGK